MRVVLDTNIYVSALALPGGRADEALLLANQNQYDLILSPAILAELANVLTRKFKWDRDRALDACREMSEIARIVRPTHHLHLLQDEPDNRILECAVTGEADAIVTGDKHLLKLNWYEKIEIITLAQFLQRLNKSV